mmetsp:Transcript_8376/g.18758  ORF Transcript_8376/g.18758 Transcript_8376/m.18758 type:complete len:261 (-) Transcript_8376:22-804(-)
MSSKEGAVIITSTPSDSAGLIGHVFCPDPSDPDALSLIAYLEDTGCVVTHTAIDATLTQDAAIAQFSVANNGATVEYLVDLLQSSPVIFREGRLSLLHRQLQQEEYALSHPFLTLLVIPRHATPSHLLQLGFSRELMHHLLLLIPLSPPLVLVWIHLMMALCLSTQCSRLHAPSGLPTPVDTLRCRPPLRPRFSWSLHRCYTTTKRHFKYTNCPNIHNWILIYKLGLPSPNIHTGLSFLSQYTFSDPNMCIRTWQTQYTD